MEYKEFTGKTVDEAVEKGLVELGIEKENADIRIIKEKKGLFGTKAVVEIAPKQSEESVKKAATPVVGGKTDGERTVEFLEGLFELLHVRAATELVSEDDKVVINVTAANTNSVIGKHGVMLDAIQTLAGAVANIGREDYKRVVVDCENYRENRETTLKRLADNLAQKAIRMGRKIKLEPMNPYERRIIHASLSECEGVKTESEGKEPNRYIVIVPKNLEDPTAPAIPARGGERRGESRGRVGRNERGGRGGYGRGDNRRGNGNRDGYKKFRKEGVDSSSAGGTTMKKSTDFFGIFLGNSGNGGEEK